MNKHRLTLGLLFVVSLVWGSAVSAAEAKKTTHATKKTTTQQTSTQKTTATSQKIMLTPDELQWKDGPPQIPNAKMTVLEGDPKKAGIFVTRLKLPAGTKIPTHTHDNVERVTVISGKIYLAMGSKQQNPTVLPAGSYFSLPAKTVHNAWVEEETILQLSSNGPWSMTVQSGDKAETGNQ